MADDRRTADERLARIARRQHGLVTREQVLGTGLSRDSLERRLERRRMEKVGWHVYLLAGAPRGWEQRALAACLDHGPPATLSHESAAMAWGIELSGSSQVHLTVPYEMSGRRRARGVTVHRSRRFTAADRVVRRQLPVTTVARTLVDLAATVEYADLVAAVDVALSDHLVAPKWLLAVVDRSARQSCKGTKALRRLVTPWLDAAPDSVAECRLLRLVVGAGLPEPVPQYEVSDGRGRRAEIDFAWPEQGVALELDGFRWHANPTAHARDARRATWLTASGWVVLRVTPTEVATSPDDLLAALRRLLSRSPATGGPLPTSPD